MIPTVNEYEMETLLDLDTRVRVKKIKKNVKVNQRVERSFGATEVDGELDLGSKSMF